MEYLEPINETSYLSVPNAQVYRKIMRCFYREYEKMNFQLYKEDVFKVLKEDELFEDYSMDQLVLDLNALVKWKNLTPIQDPGRVYTIADYKNKQYQLHHVGICGGNRAPHGPPGKSFSGIGKSLNEFFCPPGKKPGRDGKYAKRFLKRSK